MRKVKKMDKYTYRFLKEIMNDEQRDQLQAYLLMNGTLEFDAKKNNWKVKEQS
tara:strand:+ start:2997 stop:3155 length:159 start_codon:yes stop_codon:yes gene_type:complete